MITKNEIQEKIGKKSFLSDGEMLTAKLDYQNGIEYFDEILNGKSLKQANAVIHVEKYPKGFLLKLAKGFGGIKTYNYPIASNQIRNVKLNQKAENHLITFELENRDDISFVFEKSNNVEVTKYFSQYVGISDKTNKNTKKQSQPKFLQSEPINDKDLEYFSAKQGSKVHAYLGILISIAVIGIGIFITASSYVEFKYGPIGLIVALGYGLYNLSRVYKVLTFKVALNSTQIKINDKSIGWKNIKSVEYRIASYLSPVIIIKQINNSVVNIPAVISELDYIKSQIEKNVENIIRNNQ